MKWFTTRKKLVGVGIVAVLVLGIAGTAIAYYTAGGGGTGTVTAGTASNVNIDQLGGTPMYNSTIDALAYQYSYAFYATGANEVGNEITLANGGGPLSDVVVAMTNFNTTPGSMRMTLNIWNPGSGGPGGGATPGTLIATDTQTITFPATATGYEADNPPRYGLANFNAVFNDFTWTNPNDEVLPATIVYGIQYDTWPQGSTDSGVNVQLANETTNVSVGSDAHPGYLFMSVESLSANDTGPGELTCSDVSTTFAEYSTASCDNGNEGLGTPAYVPAVEFDTSTTSDLYPGGPSQPINFSVTNAGSTSVQVVNVDVAVATDPNGYVEAVPGDSGSGVTGCYASWFTVTPASVPVNQNLNPGGVLDWVGAASISMINESYSQDACEGATIGLTFTASNS